MNDHEMDRLLRGLEPQADVESMLRSSGRELLVDIMATPEAAVESTEIPAGHRIPPPRRPARWLLGVAAAVAVALAVTLPMTVLDRSPATRSAGASQHALDTAVTPYLEMDNPDWRLTDLDEAGDEDSGFQLFTRSPETTLEVTWDRIENYPDRYATRIAEAAPISLRLFGTEAELFERGSGRFDVLLQPDPDHYVSVQGRGMADRDGFLQAVAGLRPVSEEPWVNGLADDTVTPNEAPAVAQQMLLDVPRPKDLIDSRTFRIEQPMTYDVFAMTVTQPRICNWIYRYTQAREAGDQERMAEVAEVLQGSRDWAVLKRMSGTSQWRTSLWTYADRASEGLDIQSKANEFAC